MESQFYQINLLKLLLKWKKHLVIIAIVSAGLAAVFSGKSFITPKFKSYAIVYPSNIAPYSDESETEQMLQILQSSDIRDTVIKRFDLARHYEIDSSHSYFRSTMQFLYSKNVKISKTPYEAVLIEVHDKDPDMACNIVNAILQQYNRKVRSLHEEKFYEVVGVYERGLIKKREHIDSLVQRLHFLGTTYGLLDYSVQAEQITKGFLRTIDGTGAAYVNTSEVLKLKENVEKMGGEMVFLVALIEEDAALYAGLKYDYEKAYMDYDRRFTYVNEIVKPFPADKKVYPIRWLIVVISMLAATFIGVVTIMIIENKRLIASEKTT